MRLGLGIPRRRVTDPVVNGFTRRSSGYVSKGIIPATVAPFLMNQTATAVHRLNMTGGCVQSWGKNVKSVPGGYYMTWSGVELAAPDGTGGSWLGAYRDDNAHSTGAAGAAAGPLLGAGTSDLTLELFNGQARVWADGALLASSASAHGAFSVRTFCQASGNPDSGETAGKVGSMPTVLVMRRRDIELVNCPSLGSVVADFGTKGQVTTTLDGDGAGIVAVPPGVLFPCAVTYTIKDSFGATKAVLTIAAAYGGDIVGTAPRPAPATFSPLSLPSTQIWLAPEQLAALNAGDAVNGWTDQATGRSFAKYATIAAPVIAPGTVAGKKLVRFDGTARSLMRDDSVLRYLQGCWFFVFKWNALATEGAFSVMDGADSGFNVCYNGGGKTLTAHAGGTYDYLNVGNADLALHLVTIQHGPGFTKVYLDGTLMTTGGALANPRNIQTGSFGTFYAAANMAGASSFGNFDLGEFAMCAKVLSDADRNAMVAYFKQKWGIA